LSEHVGASFVFALTATPTTIRSPACVVIETLRFPVPPEPPPAALVLWGFDIVSPGVITKSPPHENGGCHLQGPPHYTSYDSLAVERDGNICVASLVIGGINVTAADGTFVEFVPMPDQICTNICFGGPDLMTAYITLSSTGRVVSMPWPRPGLRLNFDLCG
jgi:hypothetical protein